MSNYRRTGILCTIGPSSRDEKTLAALLEAGMNMVRLNFSHGTHQEHEEVLSRLQRLSQERRQLIPVLQDLSGPKIRLGEIKPGTVLKAEDSFVFTGESIVGDAHQACITYPRLAQEVEPGNRILIDDGLVELEVDRVADNRVYCTVKVAGPLSSHKGVNLPGAKLSVPALTEKDAADLRFGLQNGVDFVALSFVRQASDIEPVHKLMEEMGIWRPVIAKIEKPEALDHIEEIIEAFDGVMVARGDLGVEMPMERVPLAQKRIIHLARRSFKPVITATQLLDSMIRNPRPTRAEVTDIANAIWDGTDVIMLSGETASGAYPVEAVKVMDSCAKTAESVLNFGQIHQASADLGHTEESLALCACEIAEVSEAKAIVVCTTSGKTARLVSHYRPRAIILGLTHELLVARRMGMHFGVIPAHTKRVDTADEVVLQAISKAQESGYVKPGEKIVVVAGFPPGSPTNLLCSVTI